MIDKSDLKELIIFSKRLKILYVEDSLEAREQALKLFGNFFGEIVIAVDGQDGLDKFKKDNTFDVIFTDLNMPILNGIDMTKEIRLINTNIPIYVISAHNEVNFQEDVRIYNIERYVIKPVSLDNTIDILLSLRTKLN